MTSSAVCYIVETSTPTPIDLAKESALRDLSRLLLWLFLPGVALLFFANWQTSINEPLRYPVYVLIPVVGLLIRPAPTRPLQRRGELAIGALVFTCMLVLIKSGPRHPNIVGLIAMTFSLAALFGGVRWLSRLVMLFITGGVVGVALRALGLMTFPTYPPQTIVDETIRLTIALASCVFIGRVLYSTVGIYRDANLREQDTYARLLDVERAAQRLQRQELATTMARGMAHDLANFMQVMTASMELMQQADDREVRGQVAADASVIAARATRTLRALLAVGKVAPEHETGDGTTSDRGGADVHDLCGRLVSVLEPVVGTRIAVSVQCRTTERVAMRAEQLEQVLLNLAFNARDAMPEGGTLSFVADDAARSGDGVSPIDTANAVRITVTDTGVGIPVELQQRIFDPYVTTKPAGEGTGLGLAIVARAVEDVGGRVEVFSDVGEGTRFVLTIPAVKISPAD